MASDTAFISERQAAGQEELDQHYRSVANAIKDGEVVMFLGAGANLCGRPENVSWRPGQYEILPSGQELAQFLNDEFKFPSPPLCAGCTSHDACDKCPSRKVADLLRVSLRVAMTQGHKPLYDRLHGLFDGDYPPTSLHEFLAWLPGALRARGHSGNQLILSTNYDDVLERAFDAAGESFDLLTYIAKGRDCGKFSHQPPGGEPRVIERPNEYYDISLKTRSVIIKIHGAVKRKSENASGDSYVITEDDYLDYLTRTDISNLVPAPLAAKLKNSNFLFLGHSLRDWNLRVILRRIWGEQELDSVSWAVQRSTDELDRTFWAKHNVKIWAILLEDYVAALHRRVQTLLAPAAAS